MTTAIDTNILSALWSGEDQLSRTASAILHAARKRGDLIIPAPVYAELLAGPARTSVFIDEFCHNAEISIDWNLAETVWRTAGTAFQTHSAKRRRNGKLQPRRILADFLIGAYALHRRCQLLTFDTAIYKSAFPTLNIVSI